VRAISVETLRELGYSVIEAAGAREAIHLVESGSRPDLVFTDVVMPEMTGSELAKALQPLLPDAKILFTTGYTRNAIVHNGVLDAGTHLISKPYTINDLAEKVRALLDGL
jgi:CheY-like chemotaxis protein